MKRYIFNTLMCGALALGSFSCTDKYIDINSDPYQPGDLNPDDYALGSAMSNLAGTVISDDNNTAQFTDCLLGGTCGGYAHERAGICGPHVRHIAGDAGRPLEEGPS